MTLHLSASISRIKFGTVDRSFFSPGSKRSGFFHSFSSWCRDHRLMITRVPFLTAKSPMLQSSTETEEELIGTVLSGWMSAGWEFFTVHKIDIFVGTKSWAKFSRISPACQYNVTVAISYWSVELLPSCQRGMTVNGPEWETWRCWLYLVSLRATWGMSSGATGRIRNTSLMVASR